MGIYRPLIYRDGFYRVLKDGDMTPGHSVAKRAESFARRTIVVSKKSFTYQIFFGGDLPSGSWYNNTQAGNHTRPSGSWSGWVNAAPCIIPYNCKITKLILNFSRARYDWRSTPGNIFLDIGFLDHNYNSTFNERILRNTIISNFSGGDTNTIGFRYIIDEDNMSNILGNNMFYTGETIGVLSRAQATVPGRIFNISNPYINILFGEV